MKICYYPMSTGVRAKGSPDSNLDSLCFFFCLEGAKPSAIFFRGLIPYSTP